MTIKQIPTEVCEVAYQHHEDNLGTGYPRAIGKNDIHPYAQIIRMADLFAGFAVKNPAHPIPMSGPQAVAHIETHYGESVLPEIFAALKAIVAGEK